MSFHLNFLCVAPVEPTQCGGLPEPEVSNMSRSTTTCFDYKNKLKPFKSSCPDGVRLASHDPVCDPILRKWVVRQWCYTVKCFNFLHIQHAEVQSLCNEGCSEGHEVATNTLKCQAVDNMTPLVVWVDDASCTSVSCGVPPKMEHTLHGTLPSTRVPLDIHWTDCVRVCEKFSFPCKAVILFLCNVSRSCVTLQMHRSRR